MEKKFDNFKGMDEQENIAQISLIQSLRFKIFSTVYWNNQAPWDLDWRVCRDTFILAPDCGEVLVKLEKESFVIGSGTILLLPPHTPHCCTSLDRKPNRELHQYSLHFDIVDQQGRIISFKPSSYGITLSNPKYYYQRFLEFSYYHRHHFGFTENLFGQFMQVFFSNLIMEGLRLSSLHQIKDIRVSEVLEYIHQNIQNELSIPQLAEIIELKEVQFRKIFHRSLGMSPHQYIQKYRMDQAIEKLTNTSKSIKEITYEVGFQTPQYFNLSFQKMFRCSPGQYRQMSRKGSFV